MAISQMTADFPCSVETLWNTVTNLEDTGWRSDLSRVEILSGDRFVEYTKSGFDTRFTVTAREPLRRWAFDMENGNLSGSWTGEFAETDGGARLTFVEQVTEKHWWMKPFVLRYLKRQQALYLADLRRKLENSR